MAEMFFPQMSTGAMAQYPIKKTTVTRAITNVLIDRSMILLADAAASKIIWEMRFAELSTADVEALQGHFQACCGAYHAFTFIDPTDNMLASSADLTSPSWTKDPLIDIAVGQADPNGALNAFTVTNTGSTTQALSQSLVVPANYQYCFSLYASTTEAATLTLGRKGATDAALDAFQIGPKWTRITSSGRLNDAGTQLTVAVNLAPGQQIDLFGLQLEAQVEPSRYRRTDQAGGVYRCCHWATDVLSVTAQAPELFSTTFAIQTSV
jgi:hypothetical protein